MNEERRPISHSGSARLLITFFLGVSVGMSLLHAWHTARAPETDLLAQNGESQAPEASKPPPEIEDSPPPVETGELSPVPIAPDPEVASEAVDDGVPTAPEVSEVDAPDPAPEPDPEPSYADLQGLWPARHMFVGLPGPELDEETRAWLEEFKPGGIVLRPENIMADWQVRELIASVREAVGLGDRRTDLPLFAIAQEGGPQANPLRMEDAPSAESLGRAAAPALALALEGSTPNIAGVEAAVAPIRETGARYARYAREQGFAVIFGPVLDVFRPGLSDPRLRDRTYSTDAVRVSVCGQAFHDGVLSEGVIPVVKHYPGLGAAKALADGTLVIQETDKELLAGEIFLPYALAADRPVAGMMVAPVAVPVLDQSGRVASLSPRIAGAILRERWNFEGVVLAANMDSLPPGEAFAGALAAGCDAIVLEIVDRAALNACAAALAEAVANGDLTEDALAARRKRLEVWQTRIGGTPGRVPEEAEAPEVVDDSMTSVPEETEEPEEIVVAMTTEETEEPEEIVVAMTTEETEEPEEIVVAMTTEADSIAPELSGDEDGEDSTETEPTEIGTEAAPEPETETVATAVETAPDQPEEEGPVPSETETQAEDAGAATEVPAEDTSAEGMDSAASGDADEMTATNSEVQGPPVLTEADAPAEVTEEAAETRDEVPETGEEEDAPLEPVAQPEGTKSIAHTIKRGDTLNGIARLYRVSVNDLMAWNALEDGNIKFGFNLKVYVPEAQAEEVLVQEVEAEAISYYTIQPGDKLKVVAERFGISEDALIQLNGITNPDKILSGQRLKVPSQATAVPEQPAEAPADSPTPTAP